MPTTRKEPNRKRPDAIRVMVTPGEKRQLQRAARKAGAPVSGYIRDAGLEKARRKAKKLPSN
jgi:hypothetical protein